MVKRNTVSQSLLLIFPFLLLSCAEKKIKIWIEPPLGTALKEKDSERVIYQVEDLHSGKKENLSIPVEQVSENLVVERHIPPGGSGSPMASATTADRAFATGKLLDAPLVPSSPSVSYLAEVAEIEKLHMLGKYSDALIRIAPLIEQYPMQTKLFLMQGTLFRKLGERSLAIQSFERAARLDSGNTLIEETLDRLKDQGEAWGGPSRN